MNVAGLNLETPAPTKTDDKYSGLNSLSDMITQINSNTLCVGGSATNMNVFVNEQKIVDN